MPAKYHVEVKPTEARFFPVPQFSAVENDGCLGCMQCVKRDSCVYDVYRNRSFDTPQVVDTADVDCISCMRCVQECKKNIIFRMPNPEYKKLGNEYWRPDILTNIWKQAGYFMIFFLAGLQNQPLSLSGSSSSWPFWRSAQPLF